MEIYLSYISKTIDESFPNPHLIITEHPDKWLGTDVFTAPVRVIWTIKAIGTEQRKYITGIFKMYTLNFVLRYQYSGTSMAQKSNCSKNSQL